MLTFNESSNTFISSLFPQTVTHGFGTRMSGNGRNIDEIKKYLIGQGIKYKKVIDPDQQHGDQIAIIDTTSTSVLPAGKQVWEKNCDGLITQDRGVVLTVITADCAPIIYSDVHKSVVGISHNGRKGTELQLAFKMIKRLQATGSKLQDIHVAIGPSIGACCYPINLVKENVEQLIESGLAKDQIDFFPFCTKCDSKRFFSYRNSRNVPFGSVYAEERSTQGKPNFPEQSTFIMLS